MSSELACKLILKIVNIIKKRKLDYNVQWVSWANEYNRICYDIINKLLLITY